MPATAAASQPAPQTATIGESRRATTAELDAIINDKSYSEPDPHVLTKYDEFRDTTATNVSIPLRRGSLELLATSRGRSPLKPLVVLLGVRLEKTKTWEHIRRPSLICLTNSDRLRFDRVEHQGTVVQGGVIEQVITPLTPIQFHALIQASSIRCQLDFMEFELESSDLDAIHRFAAKLGVTPSPKDAD